MPGEQNVKLRAFIKNIEAIRTPELGKANIILKLNVIGDKEERNEGIRKLLGLWDDIVEIKISEG